MAEPKTRPPKNTNSRTGPRKPGDAPEKTPDVSGEALADILASGPCVYCGAPATTVDHVTPLAKGGRHAVSNLVPACQPCNSSKAAKLLANWNQARVTQALACSLKVCAQLNLQRLQLSVTHPPSPFAWASISGMAGPVPPPIMAMTSPRTSPADSGLHALMRVGSHPGEPGIVLDPVRHPRPADPVQLLLVLGLPAEDVQRLRGVHQRVTPAGLLGVDLRLRPDERAHRLHLPLSQPQPV